MRPKLYLLILLVFILTSNISNACPYCIYKKDSEPRNELKLDFALGLDLRKGNTDKFTLNSGVDLKYRIFTNVHTLAEIRIDSDYYIDLLSDKITTSKFYTELLFYYYLKENWSFFIYSRPSNNSAQKLDYRFENGIGVKINFLQDLCSDPDLNNEVSLSAAFLYDIHQFSKSDLNIPEDAKLSEFEEYLLSGPSTRLSIRAKCSLEIIKNMRIMSQIFWQPSLSNLESIQGDFGKDYRILIRSELSYLLSPTISLNFKLDAEYNSMMPDGLKNWDWTLINGIKIKIDSK